MYTYKTNNKITEFAMTGSGNYWVWEWDIVNGVAYFAQKQLVSQSEAINSIKLMNALKAV